MMRSMATITRMYSTVFPRLIQRFTSLRGSRLPLDGHIPLLDVLKLALPCPWEYLEYDDMFQCPHEVRLPPRFVMEIDLWPQEWQELKDYHTKYNT
jgi:hypothetical protein